MTDQREASSAGGSQGLTGGRLPTAPEERRFAPVGGDHQRSEQRSERATPPEVIRVARSGHGGGGGRAAAAVQSTIT
ncbi:hypothetical protein Scep_014556 [Stephania cephalantha]|uniref:Uncharacterized protein n=1 Tax=Stephania cephalantha TaxID=152367 RepID=A0AAP0P1U3_9MAGN